MLVSDFGGKFWILEMIEDKRFESIIGFGKQVFAYSVKDYLVFRKLEMIFYKIITSK